MRIYLTLALLFTTLLGCAQKTTNNVDAEELEANGKVPKGWKFGFNEEQNKNYTVLIDSTTKHIGKHAISVSYNGGKSDFFAINYPINKIFDGQNITLKGYIKTRGVKTGYAGLWMRIDGEVGSIAFDNMSTRGAKGDSEWTQYTITLAYNSEEAKTINIGGLLVGDGKAWFDGFELFIGDQPIEKAAEKKLSEIKAAQDTAFSNNSGIKINQLNDRTILNLTIAGQFWGFLKYHHPSIAASQYNWDAELFRHLQGILEAKDDQQLSQRLEAWADQLPEPKAPSKAINEPTGVIAFEPDYGNLFNKKILSASLIQKLTDIKNAIRTNDNYYISFIPGVGNPQFKNEKAYSKMEYPDAGYRILCLYRYWAMINYFFPYKDVIKKDWNTVLKESVPEFVNAKNKQEYALTALKLIAGVHDTHANIWSNNVGLEAFKGKYKLPFSAEFIENKLVVTNFSYGDTLGIQQKIRIGDVITAINGKSIKELIEYYLPYTAASNYDTQLRDLPSYFLLRGQAEAFTFAVLKEGKEVRISTPGIDAHYYSRVDRYADKPAFKMLANNIAYIFPAKYRNKDLPAIKMMFKDAKGIIVDMRCYPSDFMPFTFGSFIKPSKTAFVKFTTGQLQQPGRFTFTPAIENGGDGADAYKGKVVVIVDASSQSQAEYTTVAFQSAPDVTVIGSTTAGADGNVSQILLPGGISTMISGIGIFYPDGTPTQRIGVKIDKLMKPTIRGTIQKRDELLDEAKSIINSLDHKL